MNKARVDRACRELDVSDLEEMAFRLRGSWLSQEDAEDVQQTVFVRLLDRGTRLTKDDDVMRMLRKNAWRSRGEPGRKGARQKEADEIYGAYGGESYDCQTTMDDRLDAFEFVQRLLRRLPELQALVVMLRDGHSIPIAEIARRTGRTKDQVDYAYKQGLKSLKAMATTG